MAYNLKDVQYLSNTQELTNTVYGSGGVFGAMRIDISSMVNTISGKAPVTGLSVYKVFFDFSSDAEGAPVQVGETGAFRVVATAKDIGSAGNNIGTTGTDSLTANSALTIAGFDWYGAGAGTTGNQSGGSFLKPSAEVPYVVVRDTIFILWQTLAGLTADIHLSVRLEVATQKITKDLMNQLIRTQSQ